MQHLGERVVARHFVFLAAFLMQVKLPAGTLRPEILDFQFQRGADTREGIGVAARNDERPDAQ